MAGQFEIISCQKILQRKFLTRFHFKLKISNLFLIISDKLFFCNMTQRCSENYGGGVGLSVGVGVGVGVDVGEGEGVDSQ